VTRIEDFVRAHWWVFVVLAITLLGTLLRSPQEDHAQPDAGAGVLAAVAVLALLVRARRPEATVLVNAAAVTTYFALHYPDGPIYLSIFCSAYALSARRPVQQWWPWALTVVPIGAAIVVRRVTDSEASFASITLPTVWSLAVWAASLAIGAAVRGRGETRREQARRTATEERLRMAQDLHDGVGHGLAVIAMQAGVALHVLDKPDSDRAKVRESLLAIRDTSRESLDALRAELSRLAGAPVALAPAADLAELPALVDRVRAGGLQVAVSDHHGALPAEVSRVAYLVVQEALTNVLRHAAAASARVQLAREDGALVVIVQDDGRSTGAFSEGIGLGGMRDRTTQLGGTLEARRTPHGFLVRAVLPVGTSGEASA
jgi:signal transduction histidine kinase